MTHLLAVSGSNLTLVLGFVTFLARWGGMRASGLALVGVVAVIFFVLLARPEPRVLRAAAMGLVALAGLSAGGRRRGTRALCVAVAVLVLLDPWLARSVGFVLSTLATTGILFLAPWWRDQMAKWMPVPLAEAIAVPLAAQLACTPVVAAISGQVSLVAVVANLVAAPAVGPTTVVGLVAGLVAVVSSTLGHLLGELAGLPAWWIITVADRFASMAGASFNWPATSVGVALLTVLCAAIVVALPGLLRSRGLSLALTLVTALLLFRPGGRIGWPPEDWLMVVCDVGQGDGLVLNAGPGSAVVVDTGPDPDLMDRCLDELGIDKIPLVVLTHFHADHVDGLPGVLEGRQVAEIEASPLADPIEQAAEVRQRAQAAGIPLVIAVPGERRTVGKLQWEVLGPWRTSVPAGNGSGANNASVVMRLEVAGYVLLLSGDAEPEEETDILRAGPDLAADIFKVAHHGSANQDPDFLSAVQAGIAVISVGADNDYGHPSAETVNALERAGATIYRTDLDGDLALVDEDGDLTVVTSDR
ncbi:MAG: ComEC/Rec2 family competence protein, partial [Nocardioidaceae bacterium]